MKWKIAISGLVFLSIAALLARSFFPEPVKRPVICPVHMLLHTNGSMTVDKQSFMDRAELKAWLISYKRKNPSCFLSVVSEAGLQPGSVERVAQTMREAGFSSVGFITEPHIVIPGE